MSKEVVCPWCSEKNRISAIKIRKHRNDYGTIVDRSCNNCGKLLAAYLDEERNFFPKIRTFLVFETDMMDKAKEVARVPEATINDKALRDWETRIGLELRVSNVFNQLA